MLMPKKKTPKPPKNKAGEVDRSRLLWLLRQRTWTWQVLSFVAQRIVDGDFTDIDETLIWLGAMIQAKTPDDAANAQHTVIGITRAIVERDGGSVEEWYNQYGEMDEAGERIVPLIFTRH